MYFFKIAFLKKDTPHKVDNSANYSEQTPRFMQVEDWPVMLVEGEVTPSIITGTIRYGDRNNRSHSQPIQLPGRVYARMIVRLDPSTGKTRKDLLPSHAVGYFNAKAQGHYEVHGLAPGVYNLYASAAGFPQTIIASAVTVLKGQSLHFDGYLQPGPVIHGNVFSKHHLDDTPWLENAYVKIELYDGPTFDLTFDHIWKAHKVSNDHQRSENSQTKLEPPDGSKSYIWRANKVSWSPLLHLSGGQQNTNGRARGPQDVGPPQDWVVEGGTTRPFHFEFGVKGEYGAPRDLDGMVPQPFATWVNGLTPGRYYVRAWVPRYNQSAPDGSTFQEYYFYVMPNEWAGEVTLPIDLRT
jgi:hypothetical protein